MFKNGIKISSERIVSRLMTADRLVIYLKRENCGGKLDTGYLEPFIEFQSQNYPEFPAFSQLQALTEIFGRFYKFLGDIKWGAIFDGLIKDKGLALVVCGK